MGRKNLVVLAGAIGLLGCSWAMAEPATRPATAPAAQTRPTGRPWLGVTVTNVNEEDSRGVADDLGYLDDIGLLVQAAAPDSPAAGKFEAGDILVEANGVKLTDVVVLREQVATAGPGGELTLSIVRQQKIQTVKVTVGIAPPPAARPKASGR